MDNDKLLIEIHKLTDAVSQQARDREAADEFRRHLLSHMDEEKQDRDLIIKMSEKIAAHDVDIKWLQKLYYGLVGSLLTIIPAVIAYWIYFLMQHKEL